MQNFFAKIFDFFVRVFDYLGEHIPDFLEKVNDIVVAIDGYLGDYVLIFLLIGIGLYFTIRTRFVQVRCFGEGWRRMFGNLSLNGEKAGKHGMSSFQALATAIAAQVGTGNIVGACGAILVGGPGAIFWMWVIAFFGMATIYAEATLAQATKTKDEAGETVGGPVYYIKRAFKGKFGKVLAALFSIFAILALGWMGAMVQSNSIGESMNNAFNIPTWVSGIVVAALAGIIFLGGVKSIASVTEKIVPIMACLYIAGSLVVIGARITYIPETFGMIFRFAFVPQAIIGGGIGYAIKTAISQGAKRGLFSNEAGMGSTPHAHAVANVEKPHDQGVVAMTGVFIDTFVVLTMTALVVISTIYAGHTDAEVMEIVNLHSKTNLAQEAFGMVFGETFGNIFVAICLFFFAFSTIVGWNFFGKLNINSLFGNNKVVNAVYGIIAVGLTFLGTCISNELVWNLQDVFDMLIVIPNVIALAALGGMVVKFACPKKEPIPEIPAEE